MEIVLPEFGKKRSSLEISAQILESCIKPNIPTRIMYANNLSWVLSKRHLKELSDKGYLQILKIPDNRIKEAYMTSDKGKDLIRKLRDLDVDL